MLYGKIVTESAEEKLQEYLDQADAKELKQLGDYIAENNKFPDKLTDQLKLNQLSNRAESVAFAASYVRDNFIKRATLELNERLLNGDAIDLSNRVAACNANKYDPEKDTKLLTADQACPTIKAAAKSVSEGTAVIPRR